MLVLISSMAVVGFSNSADCVIETGRIVSMKNNAEDGNFELNSELSNDTLDKLKSMGVKVDENFYYDYKLNNNQKIRLFKERKGIDRVSCVNGENIEKDNEIAIDEHFGIQNKYKIGDALNIDNREYVIKGYIAAPDYTIVVEKPNDVLANPKEFGIGFISEEDFASLKHKNYLYTFKLNGVSAEKIKNIIQKNENMISFMKASDNPRITGYIDDTKINKNVAIMFGSVLFIMIAFMISMSVINNIDKESPMIGTLYSLGYVKSELMKHFMILPIFIVFLGATIGTLMGFVIEGPLSKSTTDYYSLPVIKKIYSPYLFVLGIVFPVLIVIIVNYRILSSSLRRTPLQLLRKEKRESKLNTIKIRHFSFITKYRLREFFREIRGNIILFCGILISIFLLVFGVGINRAISKYIDNVESQCKFEYTYILKLPVEVEENEKTEKSTFKGLAIYYKTLGQDMDVTLQGIKENSGFYDFNIKDDDSGVYMSESAAKKFGLKPKDIVTLKDTAENKVYRLRITGTVKYSSGLYIFMNQKQLNLLLNKSKSYFNGYITKDKLNINKDYLYSETSSRNVVKAARNMTSMMLPMVVLIIILSTILFVICMYLLLKIMIDKSVSSISLIKIFGFNQKEINKLYLSTSLYMVIFSSCVGIPLSYNLLEIIYPSLISNVQAYFDIYLTIKDYFFIIIVISASYFASITLLKKYVNKISLSEALKDRE